MQYTYTDTSIVFSTYLRHSVLLQERDRRSKVLHLICQEVRLKHRKNIQQISYQEKHIDSNSSLKAKDPKNGHQSEWFKELCPKGLRLPYKAKPMEPRDPAMG